MNLDRFDIVSKVVARTYQVEEVVAEGGFGVVYRAYHKGFRARVALKCLKVPDQLSEQQRRKFLEQFRSEAEVMFRLSSHIPAIVRPLHVDAFHTRDGRLVPFMALEWLDGRTLDSLIAGRAAKGKPPLGLPQVVRLLTPVARALEQAHHFPGADGLMTVVHRDMKPENLFVARVGEQDVAKVLDFGISKVKSAASQLAGRASQTSDTLMAFSPAYAAPEQWSPKSFGQTGKWTDVWGLALTVVEAAKGAEVISGDHAQMMGMILNPERRPTPRTQGLSVSDDVERLFERALAVDPTARTQSIGEFWDGLTSALGLAPELGVVGMRAAAGPARRPASTTGIDSDFPGSAAAPGRAPVLGPTPARGPADAERSPGSPGLVPRAMPAPGVLASGPGRLPLRSEASGMMAVQSAGRRVAPARAVPQVRPSRPSLQLLGPGLSMMALSVALTILDRTHSAVRGAPVSLGPLKLSWVAAVVMVVGLVSAVRAFSRMSEH